MASPITLDTPPSCSLACFTPCAKLSVLVQTRSSILTTPYVQYPLRRIGAMSRLDATASSLRFTHDQKGKRKRCTEGTDGLGGTIGQETEPADESQRNSPPPPAKEGWAPFPYPPTNPPWRISFAVPTSTSGQCGGNRSTMGFRCEGASNFPVHRAINCQICSPITWSKGSQFLHLLPTAC